MAIHTYRTEPIPDRPGFWRTIDDRDSSVVRVVSVAPLPDADLDLLRQRIRVALDAFGGPRLAHPTEPCAALRARSPIDARSVQAGADIAS